MSDHEESPPVSIVGAGAIGSTLARALVACGYRVEAVLSRTLGPAQDLAERIGAPVAASSAEALPETVRLVLVCVPDEAISTVATSLAALDHSWDDTIVGHTSGAKTAAALAPVARTGALTLSFHPLQTFAGDTPPEALEGVVVGLEGDDRAVAAGETLARAFGARPVRLTPAAKMRYHCAAALASNGLVALMAVVEEVFGSDTQDRAAVDIVGPLVEQTWSNLKQGTPEGVLTGPVVRGDEETVQAHLDALTAETPHLVPLYAALSTEMARTAVRGGHLAPEQADALLATLRDAADAATE